MRIHDQGEEVRKLQRALLARGLELPRYGADGDFGRETAGALARFARISGVHWLRTDPVPEALLVALGTVEDDPPVDPVGELELRVPMFDLRSEQQDPHPKGKTGRGGTTIKRAPAQIDGVMLHQTGCLFEGSKPISDIKLARRSLDVACHALAFRRGIVAWPTPLEWYLYHGNSLSSSTLGLEVEGHYPGIPGRPLLGDAEPTPESETTILAACEGLRLLVEEGRRAGCPIRYLYAHRQTDSWRRADPGWWLWQRVGLDFGVGVLGLQTRPERSWANVKGPARHGKPVPIEWDPDGVGRY